MGVDVLLYAETTPSDAELTAAREFFMDRCRIADRYAREDGEVVWEALEFEDETEWSAPRVVANVTTRYYGPGYERGDWPSIYAAIRLMQAVFPSARVCYGGDTDDVAPEVTDESLAETWAHFLGPDGRAYFDRHR